MANSDKQRFVGMGEAVEEGVTTLQESVQNDVPHRDTAQQVHLGRLEEQAAELQRLAEAVKLAHNAMLLVSRPTDKERLRTEWLEGNERWTDLHREFDRSMREYENAYGAVGEEDAYGALRGRLRSKRRLFQKTGTNLTGDILDAYS